MRALFIVLLMLVGLFIYAETSAPVAPLLGPAPMPRVPNVIVPKPRKGTVIDLEEMRRQEKAHKLYLRRFELLARVRDYRTSNLKAELPMANILMNAAQEWAEQMARTGDFRHSGHPVAENIARGQEKSGDAVQIWVNSPRHRANMLGAHEFIGTGVAEDGNGIRYWVLMLK